MSDIGVTPSLVRQATTNPGVTVTAYSQGDATFLLAEAARYRRLADALESQAGGAGEVTGPEPGDG